MVKFVSTFAVILITIMVSLFRIHNFKIFFAETPFMATYCASKHAVQVCDAVKQSYFN